MLRPLRGLFSPADYPNLLVGLTDPDDSAVFKLDDDRAVISTLDFFPPVVDDPYAFGAIAAANALSDVYAMGGVPVMAINLVAYPDGYGLDILSEIMRGGAEKVREAGAVVAGGHTVTDKEPKYGLAVTGLVDVDSIVTKSGARIGDIVILSKPLGTGVITTALKNGKASDDHVEAATASMSRLNRDAARVALEYGVHAMTDITGYSLLGHGHEMAHVSDGAFKFVFEDIPWLPGARDYAEQSIFPGGTDRNRQFFSSWVRFERSISRPEEGLLYDPQTSGGLLMAMDRDVADAALSDLARSGHQAAKIGEVVSGEGEIIIV